MELVVKAMILIVTCQLKIQVGQPISLESEEDNALIMKRQKAIFNMAHG